jgi:hypothetical protein
MPRKRKATLDLNYVQSELPYPAPGYRQRPNSNPPVYVQMTMDQFPSKRSSKRKNAKQKKEENDRDCIDVGDPDIVLGKDGYMKGSILIAPSSPRSSDDEKELAEELLKLDDFIVADDPSSKTNHKAVKKLRDLMSQSRFSKVRKIRSSK